MASGGQLDDDPGLAPGMYFDSTSESRSALDAAEDADPLLEPVIKHARRIAEALSGYCTFLSEDSRPANPAEIRKHMMQEMNQVWNIRTSLRNDLQLLKNDKIIKILSRSKERSRIIDDCIEELDGIRHTVIGTLGDDIRAAWDDISNEHVSSKQRQLSRAAVIKSLQDSAEKWSTLSEKLLSAQEMTA